LDGSNEFTSNDAFPTDRSGASEADPSVNKSSWPQRINSLLKSSLFTGTLVKKLAEQGGYLLEMALSFGISATPIKPMNISSNDWSPQWT
jgi:hypothetical protein